MMLLGNATEEDKHSLMWALVLPANLRVMGDLFKPYRETKFYCILL